LSLEFTSTLLERFQNYRAQNCLLVFICGNRDIDEDIEQILRQNGFLCVSFCDGSSLCDRILIACPSDCEEKFKQSFQAFCAIEVNFSEVRGKSEHFLARGHTRTAARLLIPALQALHNQLTVADRVSRPSMDLLIDGFELLASIHLKEGAFAKAAGLLWYAKRLEEKKGDNRRTILEGLDRSKPLKVYSLDPADRVLSKWV
jgi:hypothetical protein